MYNDTAWLLVMAGLALAFIAQASVRSSYNKYSRVASQKGITAEQAARGILDKGGLYDVRIDMIPGSLSDNYDPRTRTLRLSQAVCNSTSIAAIGVAAHEAGHALQHYEGYAPMKLRSALVPAANLGSNLSWPIFFAGMLFSFKPLLYAGIIAFSMAVLFQLVTLPVELNASKRAMNELIGEGYIESSEEKGTRKVLTSAAMTYVASALMSILQLARLLSLSRSRRD